MAKLKLRNSTELLLDTIFEAMHEKKAENILLLDLSKIKGANFDYFVITHGNSTSQVNAIAEEVRRKVKTILHMNPAHAEGFANAEWILLDYLDVVVHIFQHEIREHYQLENLWADAIITPIEEEIPVRKTVVKKEPTTKEVIKKEIAKKERRDARPKKEPAKKTVKEPATKTPKPHERKSTTSKSAAKSTPKSKSTKSSKKA
ncbi:MAG: ribosome silencing factor [Bacteroidales bacterium]|nr:ribosome silencing factor [Bacteroidales bacterium]